MRAVTFLLPLFLGVTATAAAPGTKPVAPKRAATLPAAVGLTEVFAAVPSEGFVDDPVASDGARLAYVVTDGAGSAIARVVDLATRAEVAAIELAPITARPRWVRLVPAGVIVAGPDGEGGREVAGLVTAAGGVAWRVGPADRITPIERDGTRVLALASEKPQRKLRRFTVELRAEATGKRIGRVRSLDLDAAGRNAKLRLTVNHWTDGGTRAVGILAGTYDREQDQRSVDVDATYDLVLGKIVNQSKIVDVVTHRRRFAELASLAAGGLPSAFARMSPDGTSLELWQGGRGRALTLDQPLVQYQPKSVDLAVASDDPTAAAWIGLQVDPTNFAAVARKKADPEYWDLFAVTGDQATRRARLLATGQRLRFGLAGAHVWVMERNLAFDRGGRALRVYALTP